MTRQTDDTIEEDEINTHYFPLFEIDTSVTVSVGVIHKLKKVTNNIGFEL